MSRSAFIIIVAFFIVMTPFLGFPGSWYPNIFLVLGGLIITVELYTVFSRTQDAFFRGHEIETEVYVEKKGVDDNQSNGRNPEMELEEDSNEGR